MDCGGLEQLDPPQDGYPLGATITVTGSAESTDLAKRLETELAPLVGDRTLRFSLEALNPQVCAIRNVLPPLASSALSIWMGQGATGEANLSGGLSCRRQSGDRNSDPRNDRDREIFGSWRWT